MKLYEVEVEARVRKTLLFEAPDEATAREMAPLILTNTANWSSFLKWDDGQRAHRPTPVETIIDDKPEVVSVTEIEP